MLICSVRGVRARLLHAEMIVERSSSKIGCCLWDQFSSPHIRVPESCRVNSDLNTLLRDSIGRVLIRGREVDIVCHRSGSVDVVLVRSNLVSP